MWIRNEDSGSRPPFHESHYQADIPKTRLLTKGDSGTETYKTYSLKTQNSFVCHCSGILVLMSVYLHNMVSWFVCQRDCKTPTERISMKLRWRMGLTVTGCHSL